MSKVLIQESTLSAIGNAIRSKDGSSALINPTQMATAIENIPSGGGGDIPAEALVLTGDCGYMFNAGKWDWFINQYGRQITTNNLNDCTNMFANCRLESIPFEFNSNNNPSMRVYNMFSNANRLTVAPYINGKIDNTYYMFQYCLRLETIPEDWADRIDWSALANGSATHQVYGMFNGCRRLRRIPENVWRGFDNLNVSQTSGTYYPYGYFISGCSLLNEARNIPVVSRNNNQTNTSNIFNSAYGDNYLLKSLTFKTNEDGTPQVARWKAQSLQLHLNIGWCKYDDDVVTYGLTMATKITDDASYQALKDNPDAWTTDIAYSRYNHDSAVETINSLPDTSAVGGGNTIHFKRDAGSATDGGACGDLTEEEIAVAAAKGWTVSLAN